MAVITEERRRQLDAARAKRKELGKMGGRPRGAKSKETVIKETAFEELQQRFLGAQDALINAQLSIARGQTFLYKIEKTWVSSPKGDKEGYWKNEKPNLVTTQWEIESYLEELAENNGELSDDQDGGATYYFLTTKEPNNEALKNILDRVYGKPKENVIHDVNVTFSLRDLNKRTAAIEAPVRIIEESPAQ